MGVGSRRRCDWNEPRKQIRSLGTVSVVTRLGIVRRLAGRALLLFAAYAAVILAVVIAGFIGQQVGIWASVLWGIVVICGVVLYVRHGRPKLIAKD